MQRGLKFPARRYGYRPLMAGFTTFGRKRMPRRRTASKSLRLLPRQLAWLRNMPMLLLICRSLHWTRPVPFRTGAHSGYGFGLWSSTAAPSSYHSGTALVRYWPYCARNVIQKRLRAVDQVLQLASKRVWVHLRRGLSWTVELRHNDTIAHFQSIFRFQSGYIGANKSRFNPFPNCGPMEAIAVFGGVCNVGP